MTNDLQVGQDRVKMSGLRATDLVHSFIENGTEVRVLKGIN